MTPRSRTSTFLLAALVATTATACGDGQRTSVQDEILQAIVTTETLSRRIHFHEVTPEQTTSVAATIEDDLRYEAALAINGELVYREVVDDDTIAARALDPAALEILATAGDPGQLAGLTDAVADATGGVLADPEEPVDASLREGGRTPDVDGDARAELVAGRWVIDKVGAPRLTERRAEEIVGADPIIEALTFFQFVRTAVRDALTVRRFDENDLDYRPDEDPFDLPDEEAGEVRYDLVPTALPTRADLDNPEGEALADTSDIRKMSIYVRDGRVVRVVEHVDPTPFLEDIERTYGLDGDGSDPERAAAAIAVINEQRTAVGSGPIQLRDVHYRLENLGEDLRVALPHDGVVAGLAVLDNRGSATGTPEDERLAQERDDEATSHPTPQVAPSVDEK